MPIKKGVSKQVANKREVSISSRTFVQIIAIVVGGALLFFLREIVMVFLISLLLAAVIGPYADWGKRFGMPKGISIGIIYAGIIGIATLFLVLVVPIAVHQTQAVFNDYAPLVNGFLGDDPFVRELVKGDWLNQDFDTLILSIQESGVQGSLPQIASGLAGAFGTIITIILIFILAFYMVVESSALEDLVKIVLPKKYQKLVFDVAPQVKDKIGLWLRGQIIIMVLMFTIVFVSLSIIGVPFALALAIFTGLLEIIPFLGPIISAVPAILVGFSVSPVTAILVALIYFLAEQIEGDILTPKIMQKVIGINPIFSILALLIGFEVAGVVGAILAIPLSMVIGITIDTWFKTKKRNV
ncbi:AI-2E family transporter [Patescibacteria group bacterium]|nr:AI-2E family transporter [Patescibacteria group bacterium]